MAYGTRAQGSILSYRLYSTIDNIDSITGIGNLSRDQYTAVHSMVDSPCWPLIAVVVGLYSSLSKCSNYIEVTKVELYDGRIVPATF